MKKLAGKKEMKVLKSMNYTDDTILSMAVAKWLMDDPEHNKESLIDLFKHFGSRYRVYSFGRKFRKWVDSDDRTPYGATTNGSAMRVAPVAWYAKTLDECLALAKITAEVTHNSEEGIRGAQAVAAAIYLNRTGKSKADIKSYIEQTFGYDLNRTTAEIRPDYQFETACDKSVPESIICFLEADSFMDAAIRAISLGGDTDTMACIAGNIAAATMPVPEDIAIADLVGTGLTHRLAVDECLCIEKGIVSLKDDFPGFVDGDGQIFFLNEGIHILVAVGLDVFFESFFDLCDLFVIEFKGKIAHIL